MAHSSSSSTPSIERTALRSFASAVVIAAGAALAACSDITPAFKPSFTPVDSGGGKEVNLFTSFPGSGLMLKYPRITWSPDGSALLVAGLGPRLTSPAVESSLWAISPSDVSVTTVFTAPGSDQFVGIICYTSSECDLARYSGRVLRRKANGDTTQILHARAGFFTSANGRFILHNPDAGTYPPGGTRMQLLDVATGVSRTTGIADVSGTYGLPRPVAVSDDGGEVVVGVGAVGGFTITRYRIAEGTSSGWSITAPDGWSGGTIHDLRWTGASLHALVEWRAGDQVRYIQHAADGASSTLLGTMKRGVFPVSPAFAWRPELRTLVVPSISACDINPDYDPYLCAQTQFELDHMRDGITTRIARSYGGFGNLVISPDGRWLAYGTFRLAIKALPE